MAKKEVTQPQGFTFRSDARLRGTAHFTQPAQPLPPPQKAQEARMQGQGVGGGDGNKPMQLTEPRPFQLATERRGQVHQVGLWVVCAPCGLCVLVFVCGCEMCVGGGEQWPSD